MSDENTREPARWVPQVGDRCFVDHGGDSWEARVSSPPEYGWVGVRGSYRRKGVVSVPVSALREYRETVAYTPVHANRIDAPSLLRRPDTGVMPFFGTWPGDETDAELQAMVAKVRGK